MRSLSDIRNKRTKFPPPSPEERKNAIAGIKWAWFDQCGYEPHLPQCDFHLSTARNRMSIAGTRGGKSRSAAEELVVYLLSGATTCWIVGQNYTLTSREFDYVYERMISQELEDWLGFDPIENCIYNDSQRQYYIRTKWGAQVFCISLERPEGALGAEVDLILMSEGAQIKRPKQTYQRILRGRLASRLGDLMIPTTPAGKTSEHDPDGWLHGMYEKGLSGDPNYYTREWPSWANPNFKEDPYELQRELDPLIFAEQYLGKFVTFTGSIYSKFREAAHVIAPFLIPPHWRRYEAIDPGWTGEFAWVAGVMSEQGNLYITNEYRDQECLYEDRVLNIKNARCNEYQLDGGWYDKSRGIHNWDVFARKQKVPVTTYIDPEDPQCAEELTKLGLPCNERITNNDVMIGIDRVQRRLSFSEYHNPRLFITQDCSWVIDCLKHHAWGEKGSSIRKPANDNYKHAADCFRYICAGNLVPSEPANKIEVVGDMWMVLQEMQEKNQGNHLFDSTYDSRRGGW